MTFKRIAIKMLALSCISGVMPAFAETTTLSNELSLHIPAIQFQNQYLWAKLDYAERESTASDIYFKLRDYGVLDANTIAPSVSELTLVTDGEAPRIVDISATDARLTFISSIPLACSVVYGTSLDFGAVATDTNMNGGAIIEHNPILTG